MVVVVRMSGLPIRMAGILGANCTLPHPRAGDVAGIAGLTPQDIARLKEGKVV